MKLHIFNKKYSLKKLKRDADIATKDWDWSKGAYGHSLSLPSKNDLPQKWRDHQNNLPFADILKKCSYFKKIFDEFKCEKTSFRLMRREPKSSYGWHTDKDKGENVVRMQIPIVTNPDAHLIVTRYDKHEDIKGPYQEFLDKKSFKDFKKHNKGNFKTYQLKPGKLHHFNTNKIHTLVNFGDKVRITLLMDFLVNDWLLSNYPEIKGSLGKKGLLAKLFG